VRILSDSGRKVTVGIKFISNNFLQILFKDKLIADLHGSLIHSITSKNKYVTGRLATVAVPDNGTK
jgi:hypothetical protein